MAETVLLPGTLELLAHTGVPRSTIPPRGAERGAFEEAAGVLEQALRQAVRDPSLLPQIGAALHRMGRDAGGE
jgi:hypothetical protein